MMKYAMDGGSAGPPLTGCDYDEVNNLGSWVAMLLQEIGRKGVIDDKRKIKLIEYIMAMLISGAAFWFNGRFNAEHDILDAEAKTLAEARENQAAAMRRAKRPGDEERKRRLQFAVAKAIGASRPVDSDKYAESILDKVREALNCKAEETWPSKTTVRRAVRALVLQL
jgi:hypothetical protein